MRGSFVSMACLVGVLLSVACGEGSPSGTGGGTGGSGQGGGGGGGNLPDPTPGLVGARDSWSGTSFVVPPGMTTTALTDGVQLKEGASCSIFILSPRAAQGEPGAQARAILLELVGSGSTDLHDENGGTAPLQHRWRGLTPEGFPWVMVRGRLVNTVGQETSWAQSLVVNLGTTVAPLVGLGDRGCFDDVTGKRLDWVWLLHSLQFPGATPPSSPTLPGQLLGKWFVNTGTVFLGETYAANGHYSDQSAYQTYSQVSATEVLQTTTTFLGDGTFEAHQNRLTRQRSGGAAETHLFSIIEMENPSAPGGWLASLRQLRVSSTDSLPFEGYLVRDSN